MNFKFYLIKLALVLISEWVDSHNLQNGQLVDKLAMSSDFSPAFLTRLVDLFDESRDGRYKASSDARGSSIRRLYDSDK